MDNPGMDEFNALKDRVEKLELVTRATRDQTARALISELDRLGGIRDRVSTLEEKADTIGAILESVAEYHEKMNGAIGKILNRLESLGPAS